ncbi:hypothetical protein BU16DRAFT_543447 [Lophium mytilinum]|uniref:F-box domain-containing protein n=1 Tax=Lophium mytilinum TaxID=390894 RepID=A0A6A6QFM4_9PEZI|nr:hypothetical protein BU16DRAFT_543447 [Lophium mytilinum]
MGRTLDTLPVELLRQIAGLLPCSSVLNLLRVNFTLHVACNHCLVFRDIAQTLHMSSPGSYKTSHCMAQQPYSELTTRKWECDTFLRGKSLLETKEIALAVEKAHGWFVEPTKPQEDPDVNRITADHIIGEGTKFRRWLPQLIALHHPSALHVRSGAIWNYIVLYFDATYQIGYDDLAFAFIASLLEQLAPLDAEDPGRKLSLEEDIERASHDVTSWNPRRGGLDDFTIVSFLETYSYEISMFSMLAMIARFAPDWKTKPNLPMPSRIPFQSFFESIPPVLQNCQINVPFPKFDAEAIMTSDFMCSGEWVGYHNWRIENYQVEVPMQAIYFEKHKQDDGDIVLRSTTGVDTYGSFELLGTLSQHFSPRYPPLGGGRAVLRMMKRYNAPSTEPYKSFSGGPFEWNGWVTPFGIEGSFGHPQPRIVLARQLHCLIRDGGMNWGSPISGGLVGYQGLKQLSEANPAVLQAKLHDKLWQRRSKHPGDDIFDAEEPQWLVIVMAIYRSPASHAEPTALGATGGEEEGDAKRPTLWKIALKTNVPNRRRTYPRLSSADDGL